MADMVADFMTKPQQGSMFKRFRDLIMGMLSKNNVAKVLICDQINQTDHVELVQS